MQSVESQTNKCIYLTSINGQYGACASVGGRYSLFFFYFFFNTQARPQSQRGELWGCLVVGLDTLGSQHHQCKASWLSSLYDWLWHALHRRPFFSLLPSRSWHHEYLPFAVDGQHEPVFIDLHVRYAEKTNSEELYSRKFVRNLISSLSSKQFFD